MIRSAKVALEDDGKVKGFGFVNMMEPAGPEMAIRTLNGTSMPDGVWVSHASKQLVTAAITCSLQARSMEKVAARQHAGLPAEDLQQSPLDIFGVFRG